MAEQLSYFARPAPMSAPGPHAELFAALPQAIGELCQVVQGLVLHLFWAERYGVQLPEARQAEVQLRPVADKLERILALDPRPLTDTRPPERRLVGNCRDFSLLLTAILRHQGVPARARCGFARYFIPDHFEDHWVCEYWHAGQERWVLTDAQLDGFQVRALGATFDPCDLPRDQFLTGGEAWQLCRTGQADPDAFGIADLQGLWFVRGNLVRDVAALNKVELLAWDVWGAIGSRDEDLSAADLEALDQMAGLSSGAVSDFEPVRRLYQNDARWRVPPVIQSFTPGGLVEVDLGGLELAG